MEKMSVLTINSRIQIPHGEFSFTFVRSSGPGGQNVNKVNSKAVLRWSVLHSPSLPQEVRQRFLSRFGRRLTTEHELVLSSQRYRDQGRNVADCLEKLREMVASVAVRPVVRRPTKPTRASVTRRLEHKGRKSQKKQQRRHRPAEE
jgi:ribosome-associated protein